jgi:L-seryl-tRNA(Ser) seleniumtransferase
MNSPLRGLPAIDKLLNLPAAQPLLQAYGHEALRDALRLVLGQTRDEIRAGASRPEDSAIMAAAQANLRARFTSSLLPVINATGIIVHTNLGRAPLSVAAQAAITDVAATYSTLEYELNAGKRGKRDTHAESLLQSVTGAEAALVVNNNAGAVILALSALANGREVLISRGQLVEIGGGFRMPDVMRQSGSLMVEVGTTNKTRLSDFEAAINAQTAMLLRVHASNFKIVGFTEQPSLAQLAQLGQTKSVISFDDLGSGALLDTAAFGLAHEPTVQESLAAGFDLVAFSGDKLLGGPQAGIIVGRANLIAALKKHPLARALRLDKFCLAALVATLGHYQRGEALREIPIWQMISQPLAAIQARAAAWAAQVGGAVLSAESAVGGGSLPGETMPTYVLALPAPQPDQLAARLRMGSPPVVARIANDQLCFDPRTVFPQQDSVLLSAITAARAN